jgi:hypothetical protein
VYDPSDSYVVLLETMPWGAAAISDTWIFENSTWTNITSNLSAPPDLASPGLTWDSSDKEVVLFGGIFRAATYGSNWTWTFSNGAWSNDTHASGPVPSVRLGDSLADDPLDGYVLLFGGLARVDGQSLNDTWAFRGGVWRTIPVADDRAPSPRYSAALAYDFVDGYMVLFGGYSDWYTGLNDTWTYQSGNWTPLGTSIGGPPVLSLPQEVSQTGWTNLLLVGCPASGSVLGMVWSFLAGAWTSSNATGTSAAVGACGGAVASEGAPESAILVGEAELTPCESGTWIYGGTGWSPQPGATPTGPCPGVGITAVYDAADGYVVAFGGDRYDLGLTNETWKFSNGTWTNLTRSESTAPSPRTWDAFTYDSKDGYAVLFGGAVDSGCTYFSGNHICGETWIFGGGQWTNITSRSPTHPSPRTFPSIAYDAKDGYVLLFGGFAGGSYVTGDTWEFSNGTWTNLSKQLASAPPARGSAQMGYDPTDSCVLLYGGFDYTPTEYTTLDDTWCYSNESWIEETGGVPPPPTEAGSMLFDPSLNLMVLAGGWNLNGMGNGERAGGLYGFNGTVWAAIAYTSNQYSPFPTQYSALVYDPSNATLLLIGGEQSDATYTPAWSLGTALALLSFGVSAQVAEPGTSLTFVVVTAGGFPWLSYAYSGLPAGCHSANAARLTCSPTIAAGNVSVTAHVTDAATRVTLEATVAVEISPDPMITRFSAAPAQTDLGGRVTLNATISGGTAPVAYRYSDLPPGCTPGAGLMLNCSPSQVGSYAVTLTATDALGIVSTATATVVVHPDPAISSVAASPSALDVGQNVTIAVAVVDGTPPYLYSYSGLPTGCKSSDTESAVICPVSVEGEDTIGVSVRDGAGFAVSGSAFVMVYGEPQIVGFVAAPSIVVLGNQTTLVDSVVWGAPPLSYAYADLPTGCSSANTSALVCVPTAIGNFSPTMTVRDSAGEVSSVSTSISVVNPISTSPSPHPKPTNPTPPVTSEPAFAWGVLLGGAVVAVVATCLATVAVWRLRSRPGDKPRR